MSNYSIERNVLTKEELLELDIFLKHGHIGYGNVTNEDRIAIMRFEEEEKIRLENEKKNKV